MHILTHYTARKDMSDKSLALPTALRPLFLSKDPGIMFVVLAMPQHPDEQIHRLNEYTLQLGYSFTDTRETAYPGRNMSRGTAPLGQIAVAELVQVGEDRS